MFAAGLPPAMPGFSGAIVTAEQDRVKLTLTSGSGTALRPGHVMLNGDEINPDEEDAELAALCADMRSADGPSLARKREVLLGVVQRWITGKNRQVDEATADRLLEVAEQGELLSFSARNREWQADHFLPSRRKALR